MNKTWTYLAPLLMVGMTPGHEAAILRHDINPLAYETLAEAHPAVGRVWSGQPDTGHGENGSGTLVRPDWVLTAAHLVTGPATRFVLGPEVYDAKAVHVHPGWTGRVFKGHDLALVHLDRSVTGVAPARVDSTTNPIGAVATFVGHGQTGNGLTGGVGQGGARTAGQNTLDAWGRDFWFLLDESLIMADFDYDASLGAQRSVSTALGQTAIPTILAGETPINRMGNEDPLALEALPAPGDSGGGLFIDTDDGPALVGVVSMTLAWDGSNNSSYTDMAGFAALSSAETWLQSTLPSAAIANPAVPEPSAAFIGLIGGGAMLLPRRRRCQGH